MRISELFGKRLKEAPAEAETVSHRLLVRAGMVDQLVAGVYSYLPIGWKVIKKIDNIIRDEMDRAGGQEVMLPALQPLELWQKSGRDEGFGEILFQVTDRRERKLVLGPTHEEVVTQLVSRNVQSYRDLPVLLYQIQTKFRDEPRPRGGLLRVREFDMKDLYSFDADTAGLDVSYNKMLQAYRNLYARCGLPAVMVEADSGAIGGKDSHEFMVIAPSGEDEIILCPGCEYAANVEKARSKKGEVGGGTPLPSEEVPTPGVATIEQVAKFFGITPERTLKSVLYIADGLPVLAVIRGDLEINEIKLKNLLKATELRLAVDAEVRQAGLHAGALSPVGIKGVKVIADDSVSSGTNLVAGANKPETHLKNVNYPRDFQTEKIADVARAGAGQACPRCEGKLIAMRGIEVGHIFKLGTFLSEKLGATFIDASGQTRPIVMGCYGIGIGRLLAAAIEQNHDERGIIWPLPIAPYQVYLCPLFPEDEQVVAATQKCYNELMALGVEVLLDDRKESPGVKFADADLLGMPLRVVISPRSLQKGGAEVKWRTEKDSQLVPVADLSGKVQELIKEGMARIPVKAA